MTLKRESIITGEYYHVYNRTVGHEEIFTSRLHYKNMTNLVNYYRFPQTLRYSKYKLLSDVLREDYEFAMKRRHPLVEIYSYAFMPNHFHFLIKQLADSGIQQFISNIQNSYAKCFNLLFDRHGSLFQDRFKFKKITTNEYFIHVSRYIHLNPVTANIITLNMLEQYEFTSFSSYADNVSNKFIKKEVILEVFKEYRKYKEFIFNNEDYQKRLQRIKFFLLD